VQYQLAYTFAHNIDNLDISALPIFNLHGARGNSDFDIRQQFRGNLRLRASFRTRQSR